MNVLTQVSLPSGAGRLQPPAGLGTEISGALLVEGVVEHGDARGRELGYPTANITVPEGEIRDGVWAGTVRLEPDGEGETYDAAVSVGRRPTYYRQGTRLLEAHLLDYSGDLYGHTVLVSLHVYLRPQRRFRGTHELEAQIRHDVARVRSWAACVGRESGRQDQERETAGTAASRPSPGRTRYCAAAEAASPAAPEPGNHTGPDRAAPRHHVDWNLLINALVEIRHEGRVIRTGFVEDAMPDSSALWIALDANGPRQMFEASQGHQVWVTPQELPGSLRYRMTEKQIFKDTSAPNAGRAAPITGGGAGKCREVSKGKE